MGEGLVQRAKLIDYETLMQGAEPGGIDQRLWQVFVHLTVPICQKIQGGLTSAGWAIGWHGL